MNVAHSSNAMVGLIVAIFSTGSLIYTTTWPASYGVLPTTYQVIPRCSQFVGRVLQRLGTQWWTQLRS